VGVQGLSAARQSSDRTGHCAAGDWLALLLAHGRLEDRLFVSSLLQVPVVYTSALFEAGMGLHTPWWLAAVVALVTVGRRILGSLWLFSFANLPEPSQVRLFEGVDKVDALLLEFSTAVGDSTFHDKEPYSSILEARGQQWFRSFGAQTMLLWVLPLSVAIYFGLRAAVGAVVELRGNLKAREISVRTCSRQAATVG
jgi:hypothetical protein